MPTLTHNNPSAQGFHFYKSLRHSFLLSLGKVEQEDHLALEGARQALFPILELYVQADWMVG